MNNTQPQPQKPLSALDIWDIVRRRKFYALAVPLTVFAAVMIYGFTASQWYSAHALVSIELVSDKPLDPASRVKEQLRVVRESAFSEPVFGTVMREFDLLKTVKTPGERARRELEDRVKIEFDGEDAFYIGFEGTGRDLVTDVSNRMAELLVELTNTRRETRNEQEAAVIDEQVTRLRSTLADLDSRIQDYKQSSVEELPERVDANLRLMDSLQLQFREASTALAIEEARRAGVLSEIEGLERQGLDPTEPIMRSPNQDKLDGARVELSRLQARGYAKDHPDVLALNSEITSLERLVSAEARPRTGAPSPSRMRHTQLRAELETIDRRIASLGRESTSLTGQLVQSRQRLNASPRHESALAELLREYEVAQEQYGSLVEKQLAARSDMQIEKVRGNAVFRIVEPARVPLDPFFPNRLRLLVIGLITGLALGVGAILLAENVDSSFKDVEEVQEQTGLPVLSVIPRLGPLPKRARKAKAASIANVASAAKPLDTVVTLSDPKSIASEQFQVIAMRVRQLAGEDRPLVLTIASAAGGEGKTITAVNLAVALSISGARVLLIDGDLRRPRLHQYLGFHVLEGLGLASLLKDPDADLARYCWNVGGLTVLPSRTQSQDPLTLISSPNASRLIARLRREFQFIVIDSPPLLPVADGLVLGKLADYVLMVVRARRTTRAVMRRALESVDSSKICGVILNDVDTKQTRYSYVYQYYENTYLRGA